ncbi:MAG: cyanophycin synthetase, partial [Deltaproteobacteria bacterium]|nr:cyanophycin synthetase [Deltaproteobacteria bacterium]
YNANPGSMRAALETLKEIKGSRPGIAVLGDMLELGEQTAEAHRSIGRYIAGLGIECLIVMGEFAPALITEGAIEGGMDKGRILAASSHEEAVRILRQKTSDHDFVLVKGSRRMRMEEIVKGLRGEA